MSTDNMLILLSYITLIMFGALYNQSACWEAMAADVLHGGVREVAR